MGPTQEALCRVQSVKLHCIACPCSVLLCAKLCFPSPGVGRRVAMAGRRISRRARCLRRPRLGSGPLTSPAEDARPSPPPHLSGGVAGRQASSRPSGAGSDLSRLPIAESGFGGRVCQRPPPASRARRWLAYSRLTTLTSPLGRWCWRNGFDRPPLV
jgi:hypothetical protein